jgi:hypothetical protein
VAGDIPPMQGRIISCYKRRARRAFERTASLLVSQPAPSGRKTSSSLRLVIGRASAAISTQRRRRVRGKAVGRGGSGSTQTYDALHVFFFAASARRCHASI